MTLPDRTFGIEMELQGLSEEAAAQALRDAGIDAQQTDYTHARVSYWKVLYDASLGHYQSCEVVSPVLRGEEGIEAVRKVAKTLARAGARINRQCGLHVHVGANDLTVSEAATMVERYGRFERTIDTFMPPSRRASENQFCRSIVRSAASLPRRLRTCRTVGDLSRYIEGGNRYVKLNLRAYQRHRTIEFRHHSGTCNADKIENWIRFCLHFTEASRQVAAASAGNGARPMRDTRGMGSLSRRNSMDAKLDRVIGALRNAGNHGLSVGEIASLGRWSVASVPPYITRLRQDRSCSIVKDRRRNRYVLRNRGILTSEFANAASNTEEVRRAACRVTQDSSGQGLRTAAQDSVFNGIPAEVISFYEERRQELAER